MSKNLVIVESPAKAKTIEKFLGKDFKVVSSNGHISSISLIDFTLPDVDYMMLLCLKLTLDLFSLNKRTRRS